jgi:hypothetical protein
MAKFPKDQNGQPVYQDLQRTAAGWSVTVYMGYPFASTIRRYTYSTRQQARKADISHAPGDKSGRIA